MRPMGRKGRGFVEVRSFLLLKVPLIASLNKQMFAPLRMTPFDKLRMTGFVRGIMNSTSSAATKIWMEAYCKVLKQQIKNGALNYLNFSINF